MIDWSSATAELVELERGPMSDDALVELMLDERLAKVGIDAPFGWPLAFIDAVATYRDEGRWLELDAKKCASARPRSGSSRRPTSGR